MTRRALALLLVAGCGGPPATPPATAPQAPATRADMEALARTVEQLRAEVAPVRAQIEQLRAQIEALRAERPDAEHQFFAGERARLRAALRRGRAQVVAWRPDQQGDMVAVADRALQTIDHFSGALDAVRDIDGLIGWFDTYLSTRQQWPPNQAWLLPELRWK